MGLDKILLAKTAHYAHRKIILETNFILIAKINLLRSNQPNFCSWSFFIFQNKFIGITLDEARGTNRLILFLTTDLHTKERYIYTCKIH